MYMDLPKYLWQKWWNVGRENRPDVLILWGIFKSIAEEGFWSVPEFLKVQFEPYLTNIRPHPIPHTWIGKRKGLKIALTHAYGGAFSLDQTIQHAKLGVKLVILVGHFGGLKDGLEVGELFIPSAAYRSDGASFHLLGKEDRFVYPTEDVEEWIKNHLRQRKIPYKTGIIKTVSTMVGQTKDMIDEWKRAGFAGVDLESGVVFSVAKKFGLKAVAILHHSDHVGGGKVLPDATERQKKAKKEARKLLAEVAIKVVDRFGGDKK